MKRTIIMLLVILGCLIQYPAQAQKSVVMIITGNVKDSITGGPVTGATISAENIDLSPVQSDNNGEFKFIIMTSNPVMLQVNKERYKTFEKLLTLQERVDLNIRLIPHKTQTRIIFSDFRKNSHISGRIEGLPPSEFEDYKILVYVLTDKWYIHPWAENAEGRGYASISNDGTWKIGTVWRGYQAYRVAFLLTKKTTYPPSTVKVISDNTDQYLLAKIKHMANLIIEAPRGI